MRRSVLSAAVSGILLALVSGLLALVVANTPATAASAYLCFGYSGCQSKGMGHAGYAQNNRTMYWRMYAGHNCTNYVAYRMVKRGMPNVRPWSGGGNAHYWGIYNSSKTNQTPRVGAVAWWKRYSGGVGSSGHVAYVERVIDKNTIVVSQDSWGGDFSWRRIEKGDRGWPSGFIHFVNKTIENVSRPTIKGTAQVGERLQATNGTWRGHGGSGGTLAFQWRSGGNPVAGATSRYFTPRPEHVNKPLSVRVTMRKKGYEPGKATSAPTAKVQKGRFSVTEPTTLEGEPVVGEVLRATRASFAPRPETIRIQWRADDKIVARGQRFTITRDLLGTEIKAISIARGPGYRLTGSHTEPIGPVTMGEVEVTEPFQVSGKPRMGRTLRVRPGQVEPRGAAVSYQWLRDGQPIGEATDRVYAVQKADLGKALTVEINARKKHFAPWTSQLRAGQARTALNLNVRAVAGKRSIRVHLNTWGKGGVRPWGDAKVRLGKRQATVKLKDGRGQVTFTDVPPGERTVWARVVPGERHLRRKASATVTVPR